MMIFKKAIPRRRFLQGVGATLALPLLDGMVPAMAAVGDSKAATRLSFVYIPNGIIMDQWTPATARLTAIATAVTAARTTIGTFVGPVNLKSTR